MTNKEFLLKLVAVRAPLLLDWEDNTTVIIGDLDDVSYKSKVVFDEDGNAISVEKILERWEEENALL